jgi:hypothetical protein
MVVLFDTFQAESNAAKICLRHPRQSSGKSESRQLGEGKRNSNT